MIINADIDSHGKLVLQDLSLLDYDEYELINDYLDTQNNLYERPLNELIKDIDDCLINANHTLNKSEKLTERRIQLEDFSSNLMQARLDGEEIKYDTEININSEIIKHLDTLPSVNERPLKHHQILSYKHLVTLGNTANFSVPGAGKTTVMLAAYSYFKQKGWVDTIMIIGPVNCFDSWSEDYEKVFQDKPNELRFSGGNKSQRHASYYNTLAEMLLFSLPNDP